MSGVISSLKNRALARYRKKTKAIPFAWRVVEQGPLRGATVYVPENRSWGNDVVNGTYEAEFLSILEAQAKQGGCFYDVGGHVGIFSLAWLKMGGDFVETFEPLPANARLIADVLDRNNFQQQYNVHQLALGDFSAESTFIEYIFDSSRGQTVGLDNITITNRAMNEKQHPHSVQVVELNRLFREKSLKPPEIIKIDVEGAEHNVLVGSSELIKRHRPILLTEIHTINSALQVAVLLSSLNYEIEFLGAKGTQKSLPLVLWYPSDNPIAENFKVHS